MVKSTSDDQFTIDPGGNKKVILSVDGGGMRGAISIAMLAELETQTGKTCQEMFDMVAGTSTGAIIAVGLAVGLSANDILDRVYRHGLPHAFEVAGKIGPLSGVLSTLLRILGIHENQFFARLASHDLRYTYSLTPFLDELKPLVGNRKVGDLHRTNPKRPILLATTKDISTRDTNFIVSAGPGKDKFKDWPLSAVVGASGAAPIFFPPVLNRFVDGGVGVYSNPCLALSVEAMEYIGAEAGFENGKVIHISLGTGYVDTKPSVEEIQNYNAIDWLKYIVLENLNDGALQQAFATRAIYGDKSSGRPRMDFRRYNPLLTHDNVSRVLGVSLRDKPNPADLGLDSFKSQDADLMIEIGRAYARKIDWRQKHVMPWDTEGGHANPALTAIDPVDWAETPYIDNAAPIVTGD